MSGIGDYIHLHKQNYLDYGIAHIGQKPKLFDPKNRMSELQIKTEHHLSQQELDDLANEINKIFIEGANPKAPTDSRYKEEYDLLVEHLNKNFLASAGKITKTGNVKKADWQKELKNTKNLNLSLIETKDKQSVKLSTVKNRWEKQISPMLPYLDKLANNNIIDAATLTELNDKVKFIKNSLPYRKNDLKLSDTKNVNLINAINDLLVITAYSDTIKAQKGDVMEYAAKLALNRSKEMGFIHAKEVVKATVVGTGTHKPTIDLSLLSHYAQDASLFNETHNVVTKEGIVESRTNIVPPQNKVDVSCTIDDSEIGFTVKNYNWYYAKRYDTGMGLVSGTSLLYLLQDADSDLVNHFLNHATTTVALPHSKQVFQEIKIVILAKALRGGTYSDAKMADYLILNNNQTNKPPIILHVNTVLNRLVSQYNKITDGTTGPTPFTITTDSDQRNLLDDIRFNNEFVEGSGGINARIGNILKQMHQTKIWVHADIGTIVQHSGYSWNR